MTWLAFIFALEAGFQSHNEMMFTSPYFDPASLSAGYQIESPYVTLEVAGELFKILRVGGVSQIYIADVVGWQYAPYDARFTFFALLSYAGFTLGYEHKCFHPIVALDRPDLGFLMGGGDRIYLRYEAKIDGKSK